MTQAFTLQPLLEIMRNRSDAATRKLGQLIAAEQNQKNRLQMLEHYREEYVLGMREASAKGITRHVLHNYQDFLGRIDEAIRQQRIEVQNSANSTKAGQENWQTQNRQLKAIDVLSQRHDERERYRENRQEQKLQDEFSTRKYSQPETPDD